MLRQEPHVRPRLAWLALIACAAVSVPAALAAGGPSVGALRQRDRALEAKSRSAVLSLYALQSQLARAQSALALDERNASALRRERAQVALELQVARRGVLVTQARLAGRVRSLYEQGTVDPLAVVLGAESLDEAMSALDGMRQLATGDTTVLAQVRGARASLGVLRARLADRQRRLDAVVRAAAANARSLSRAQAERRAYIGSLTDQRRLTRAAIARLEAQSEAAQAKAHALVTAAPPPTAAVLQAGAAPNPPEPSSAPADTAPATGTLTVSATGYALPGRTATGLPVGWGVAAVDPSVIPLGTRFTVPGYGEAVAADVGGAIRGATIDLWFPSVAQADAWGRRSVTITLH